MSKRTCRTCAAITKKKTPCRIRTCTTAPLCWIHTKTQSHLRVKKSAIAGGGRGLFTTVPLDGGDRIGKYTGEILTQAQLDRRYPGDTLAEYAVKMPSGKRYVDARDTTSGNMRYINTCDAPRGVKRACKNNAILKDNLVVQVCPGRKIAAGEEIFMSYNDPTYDIRGKAVVPRQCQ